MSIINPIAEVKELRKDAMMWWISVRGQQKVILSNKYYPGRRHYSLTGREIQHIYTTYHKSTYLVDKLRTEVKTLAYRKRML